MFTLGQKDRMRATFEPDGGRSGFVSSSTPTCAVPSSLSTTSITASSAMLNWGAVSGAASYDVRIKPVSSSTWTDFTGRTGTSFNVTGLAASTNYEWQIRTNCSGSSSAYSASVTFTTSSTSVTWCASRGNNNQYEWIDLVQLGSINRSSSRETNGYINTGLSTNLVRGSSQTITYSAGFSSTAYTEYWKVWIDWNRNGTFESTELIVNRTSSSSANLSTTFTVPTTAVLGQTRMRVSMSDANQTACSNPFNYGEVEDYTVNIVASARADVEAVLASNETFEAQIYPNPASNVAHIKLIGTKDDNNQVQIYDMAGRVVYTATINGNEDHNVDLASFEKGIYIINIATANGMVERKKLVVQK